MQPACQLRSDAVVAQLLVSTLRFRSLTPAVELFIGGARILLEMLL